MISKVKLISMVTLLLYYLRRNILQIWLRISLLLKTLKKYYFLLDKLLIDLSNRHKQIDKNYLNFNQKNHGKPFHLKQLYN